MCTHTPQGAECMNGPGPRGRPGQSTGPEAVSGDETGDAADRGNRVLEDHYNARRFFRQQ